MSLSAVRVETVESRLVAVVRHRVSQPDISKFVTTSCGRVWEHLRSQDIRGGRNIAIYWDGVIHAEAGVELDVPFTESSEVISSATPAGTVATVTLLGPYGLIGSAHQAIDRWCEKNGYRSGGPQWEIYGHWQKEWEADPSKIRTDVFHHVTRAG